MGTMVSLDVRTPVSATDLGRAVEAVSARLRGIDKAFSAWRPDSWVSRLIGGSVVAAQCPVEVQRVVRLAIDLMELTDGNFSPYWRRWEHGDSGPDPTGLVKGWAAQQASDLLIAHGLPDHVVNAAGDVVVSGQSSPGDPGAGWRIGVSDPHRPRALAGIVTLDQEASRWAVATSGPAELGAHVLDPHTGRAPCAVVSATIVTRLDGVKQGAAVVDACATALVAAGDRAPALSEDFAADGSGVVLIEASGSVLDPGQLLGSAQAAL
jgi:thiamine biosynthesis lipoprotein